MSAPSKAHKADRLFVFLLSSSLVVLCAALMVIGVLLTARLLRAIASLGQ